MRLEQLEGRRLMSVSFNSATGLVAVQGSNAPGVDGADYIEAKASGGRLVVDQYAEGRRLGHGDYPLAKVKKILVHTGTGTGNEVAIDAGVKVPTEIFAEGNGTDERIQGGGGPDVIHVQRIGAYDGGAGNDTFLISPSLQAGVYGGPGNDTFKLVGTSPGGSYLDGGAGADTVDYSKLKTGMVIRNDFSGVYDPGRGFEPYVSPGSDDGDQLARFESFVGTQGNDYIYGDDAANYIDGQGGDDYIRGGGGNDSLTGGAGADALYGDAGNDQFFAKGDGRVDFLSGGTGTDKARRDASDVVNSVEGSL